MLPPRLVHPVAFSVVLSFLAGSHLGAQSQAPKRADETVVLSAFEVKSEPTSRYQVGEATSGGRIASNIMDTPASISIVTKELLQDVGAERLLDALKYTSGITEGITPNGLERVTIRGFQSDFTVGDGFRTSAGQMNWDYAIIERVEVMKGPNAILQPQGTPGGTVNVVTKSPSLNKSFGSVSAQVGLFDSNQGMFDYNYVVLPKKLALRVIVAGHDSEGWWDATWTRRYSVAPSVAIQLGRATRLVVKGFMSDYRVGTYGGIPIDPAVGTRDKLRTFPGMNRRANQRGGDERRFDDRQEGSFLLTTSIGDHVSARLAGRLLDLFTDAYATNPALANGGAVNPLTGEWVGGTVFGPGPTFTPSPAPAVSSIGNRAGGDTLTGNHFANLQNDYSVKYDWEKVKSVTTFGLAYTYNSSQTRVRTGDRGPVDLLNTRATQDVPTTFGPFTSNDRGYFKELQLYAQQGLTFFGDRLSFNGGVSKLNVNRERVRLIQNNPALLPPGTLEVVPKAKPRSSNYGVVLKPIKDVSVYFGHSSNAAVNFGFTGSTAPGSFSVNEGVQDEAGIKSSLGGGRVIVTAAYFKLSQTNLFFDNPDNYTSPPPVPRLPAIISDRVSKGYELTVNATLTKELAVVGNFYSARARDPNGVPFQASADRAGGIFARYNFSQTQLKGLGASLGVDYLGKRPGIQASGVTANTKFTPNQPSFYASARTLVNGAVYYTRGNTRYQLNIVNLLNEEYLTNTFTRAGIWVGTPINLKFSVTRQF